MSEAGKFSAMYHPQGDLLIVCGLSLLAREHEGSEKVE